MLWLDAARHQDEQAGGERKLGLNARRALVHADARHREVRAVLRNQRAHDALVARRALVALQAVVACRLNAKASGFALPSLERRYVSSDRFGLSKVPTCTRDRST